MLQGTRRLPWHCGVPRRDREPSPRNSFAFPVEQSPAVFLGEDRQYRQQPPHTCVHRQVSLQRAQVRSRTETPSSFPVIHQHPLSSCASAARLFPPRPSREPREVGRVRYVGGWLGICMLTDGWDGGGLGWEASYRFNPIGHTRDPCCKRDATCSPLKTPGLQGPPPSQNRDPAG